MLGMDFLFSLLDVFKGQQPLCRQVLPNVISPGVEPATYNPIYELYDDNVRCGRGAALTGNGVETLSVIAGDEIGFVPTQTVGSTDVSTKRSIHSSFS